MTRLYFVRHGKTEWNLEGRYQGAHGDSPLLAQSYLEIGLLAEYLNNVKFAKAYCSPIKRARVTAQKLVSLLEYPVKLESDRAFQEFDLGKMEGMKFTEVAKQFPEELDAFRHHPDRYDGAKINGESYQDVIERMTPKIKAICERYPKENILIVSHGAALCAEIRHLMGVPLSKIRDKDGLANTSTSILETTDNGQTFKCIEWNKNDYLKRGIDPTDVV